MRVQKVRMVLVVAPVSVMSGWKDEADKFLPQFARKVRVLKVHGDTQANRKKILRNAWKNSSLTEPYVIISSWGLVASARSINAFMPPTQHYWDYVILDEAHEIKNHTSNRSKCCRKVCHRPGTQRLLLTGTPFQNDTTELWSIMNMATAGKVLGKLKEFNKDYGKPIKNSRCRNASSYDRKQGKDANERLQDTLKPYMLRRKKLDFLADELPPKLETCVWVKASAQQAEMYKDKIEENISLKSNILSSDKALANTARLGAFQVITELKNLCGHPLRLLKGGRDGDIRSVLEQTDINTIIKGCKKLELAIHMMLKFEEEGHKTILFSESTQNLDVIGYVLRKKTKLQVARLDGSVSAKKREDTIGLFEAGMLDAMLLSTGAGGVGITLNRASRVIVFDPSWNPSRDAQAVDRAYRIGQTQEVKVYRLFIAGSIEEKMYEKQVHKAGLEKTIFEEGKEPMKRYFDKHELCKVFEKIPDGSCDLLKRFKETGDAQVPDQFRHKVVANHNSVIGISNHGAVYNQKRKSAFSDGAAAANKRLKTNHPLEMEESSSMGDANDAAASITIESCPSLANESDADVPNRDEPSTDCTANYESSTSAETSAKASSPSMAEKERTTSTKTLTVSDDQDSKTETSSNTSETDTESYQSGEDKFLPVPNTEIDHHYMNSSASFSSKDIIHENVRAEETSTEPRMMLEALTDVEIHEV